jgi:hypothetical protein
MLSNDLDPDTVLVAGSVKRLTVSTADDLFE